MRTMITAALEAPAPTNTGSGMNTGVLKMPGDLSAPANGSGVRMRTIAAKATAVPADNIGTETSGAGSRARTHPAAATMTVVVPDAGRNIPVPIED